MHKFRVAAVSAMTCCALLLVGGAGTAAAQDTAVPATQIVKITGAAANGKQFKGTYAIDRFAKRGSKVVAIGTLKGKLGSKKVKRSDVRMPASVTRPAGTSQVLPPIGGCQVLNLVLGPITLNLLGLVVRTNLINVRIDALPSTMPGGGLLGDLLRGITNLLNPASTPLGQLIQGLNALLALLPRTA